MKVLTQKPSKGRGFTLLELLVVVLIIGLLTSVVAPRFIHQIHVSKVTTVKAQIDAIDKAIQGYRMQVGRLPSQAEGLMALSKAPAGAVQWQGPYLNADVPADPWGSAYQYRQPSARGKDYDVLSFGADRMAGGVGVDADISN